MRGIVEECVWSVASVAVAVSAAWIKVDPKSYAAEIVELRVVDVRRTINGWTCDRNKRMDVQAAGGWLLERAMLEQVGANVPGVWPRADGR